jgi:hypothetical protein
MSLMAGLVAGACALLGWAGCGGDGVSPGPVPVEEGLFITDTVYTLDEFPFDSSDCAEVFPAGSANHETRASGAAAALRIISTSCYHVRVEVVGPGKDTVRSFDSRFGIFNRTEAEKNRGVVGYLSWDGKDDAGTPVPGGTYLWRMRFDFGSGHIRKYRTDFLLR